MAVQLFWGVLALLGLALVAGQARLAVDGGRRVVGRLVRGAGVSLGRASAVRVTAVQSEENNMQVQSKNCNSNSEQTRPPHLHCKIKHLLCLIPSDYRLFINVL